jgi:phenylalanyl-tRNA synthetase beta chain
VYEVGRVYTREEDGISESWHLGSLIAHSQSTFSEGKSYVEAFCRTLTGRELGSKEAQHWAFSTGRSASLHLGEQTLGHVGELKPDSIAAFGLGVPVSGFEFDLSGLYKQLK